MEENGKTVNSEVDCKIKQQHVHETLKNQMKTMKPAISKSQESLTAEEKTTELPNPHAIYGGVDDEWLERQRLLHPKVQIWIYPAPKLNESEGVRGDESIGPCCSKIESMNLGDEN